MGREGERRLAQKPSESEALYRRLVEHAPLGLLSADREGRILTVNERLLDMLGSPSADATRAINLLSFPPLVESGIAGIARRCLETGEHGVGELPYVSRWGKAVRFRFHFAPLVGESGETEGLHALVEDVTQQREAEEQLHWRSEFEHLLITLAKDFVDLPPEQIDEGIEHALGAIMRFTGADQGFVFELSDDTTVGRVSHEARSEGVPSPREVFEGFQIGTIPRVAAVLLRGEIAQQPEVSSLPPGPAREPFDRAGIRSLVGIPVMRKGKLHALLTFATVHETKEWSEEAIVPLRMAGEIIGNALERKRIETERDLLQEQLRQAQKMEAVGTLAGGIAHDFNNLLLVILGFGELALSKLPDGASVREDLVEMQRAGERARELVDRILTFSRRAEAAPGPVDLVPVIGESIELLRFGLPSTVAVSAELPDRSVVVNANPTEIQQVVMNMGTNAGQAMPSGGSLTLGLETVECAPEPAPGAPRGAPGRHAHLWVRDSGCGIDPDTASRIFEPYFTTKDPGQGTGLGLAVVHGIVLRLGGQLHVDSEPGRGSTFHVYLPIGEGEPEQGAASEVVAPQGRGRILFVDDEPALRRWGERTLGDLGYEVVSCADGEEALARLRREPFDALVTDQTMPRRTGVDLIRTLREEGRALPSVLLTGLLDPQMVEAANRVGVDHLLAKPLSRRELAAALHAMLGTGKEAEPGGRA